MKSQRSRDRVLAAAFLAAAAATVFAQDEDVAGSAAHVDRANDYRVTILVSNEENEAPVTDPLLVNAWGIAASDTGPWWVADNGSGYSTVYTGDGAKVNLEVQVPGAPTGTVFHGGSGLQLVQGVPAKFLFASEDGTFSAWNPAFNPNAVVVFTDPGSIYKGMAIRGDVVYSTDFGQECSVEAFRGNFFDGSFAAFETAGGFKDDSIPTGFCPFGIQAAGDSIFVTYAKKDGEDDVPGIGHGFVREFDADGNLVARVGSHGLLNSPWGMAKAPDDFGRFGDCLLVGNFGDGKINAFCQGPRGHWAFAGRLKQHRHLVKIDGLWGIGFGNGAASGPTNTLYFAAGPDEETNGYYGKVELAR